MRRRYAAFAFAAMLWAAAAAFAQVPPSAQDSLATPPPADLREGGTDWQREKCARYAKATEEALRRKGTSGLSEDFRARHNAFIASGCLEARNVCPRSKEELEIANMLVLFGMNAGMSGTFFPFSCKARFFN